MKLLDPSTVADLLSMKRSAVIALARGNGIPAGRDAAQLVLGHTSAKMTARYVSLRDSMLERAAAAIEEALAK